MIRHDEGQYPASPRAEQASCSSDNGKPNIQASYKLVSEGRISFAELERGHKIRKSLSQWGKYTENDPILRGRLTVEDDVEVMTTAPSCSDSLVSPSAG